MTQQHYRKSEFDSSFDVQLFLEIYMTDYTHSDEIALIDDIDCYLESGVYHDDYASGRFDWLEDYSVKELHNERNRLMRSVLEDAFNNYINTQYPEL